MKKTRLIAFLIAACLSVSAFALCVTAVGTGIISGDADGNRVVNTKDLITLRQYIAGLDYNTGNSSVDVSEGADMDGDGNVSLRDILILRQYLANKDVDFVVKDENAIREILNYAIIFKCDSLYALIGGKRIAMNSETRLVDGNVYFPVETISENDLGNIDEYYIKVIDGVRYITQNTFVDYGKQVFVFEKEGYVLVTDVSWIFADGNNAALYEKFALIVNNLFSIGTTLSAQMKGNRPVIFETDEMLAASKQGATARKEPYLTSWQNVQKKANQSLEVDPAPYIGKSATQYRIAACNDFINARSLAIAYYHTKDTKYLDRAIEYLMAYADADVMPGSDKHLDYSAATTDGKADLGLNIAIPLTTACDVYSLLYPYMTAAEKATFENWIKVEVVLVKKGHNYWIKNNYYGNQVGNNHVTSHLMGLICAAYALEDDELLNYAVNSAKNDSDFIEMIDRAILMSGDTTYSADPSKTFTEGEVYDRYRVVDTTPNGFGYAMYHLKFLTYSSLIMYNNGVDFFSYVGTNGENIMLPYKVYSEYLIKNDSTLGSGYYSGNSLNRESSYTLYLIADYVYDDSVISSVVKALADDGVVPGDNEQFGRSGGYIFGQ